MSKLVNHKLYNYLCFLWRLWIWLRQETPHLTWELQRVSRHKDACFSSALVSTWLIYSHTAPSAHFSLNRIVLGPRLKHYYFFYEKKYLQYFKYTRFICHNICTGIFLFPISDKTREYLGLNIKDYLGLNIKDWISRI